MITHRTAWPRALGSFMAWSAICAAAQPAPRTVAALRTAVPPVLDGALSEPCWQEAAKADGFSPLYKAAEPAREQTVGRVVYDDANLYVGIDCLESRMDLVRAARVKSGTAFDYAQGETVEIFLDARRNRRDFLQILVNTNGTWKAHPTEEMQLCTLPIEPRVTLRDNGFSVEVRVPFAALHLGPNPERTWGFNLCRARMIEGGMEIDPNLVYSAWQNTGGAFRQPERFGTLKVDADLSEYWIAVSALVKEADFVLDLENLCGRDRDLVLNCTLGERAMPPQPAVLPTGGKQRVAFPRPAGKTALAVTLTDRVSGRVCYVGGTAVEETASPTRVGPSTRFRVKVDTFASSSIRSGRGALVLLQLA